MKLLRGFTLVELMIVVAIIGILAAVALPKFANVVIRAKEARVKADLGAIRGALTIYYADTLVYPNVGAVSAALVPSYINQIRPLVLPAVGSNPGHAGYAAAVFFANCGDVLDYLPYGYYSYCQAEGSLYIACTHPDSRERIWSTY